jgi:hypothetical protein
LKKASSNSAEHHRARRPGDHRRPAEIKRPQRSAYDAGRGTVSLRGLEGVGLDKLK